MSAKQNKRAKMPLSDKSFFFKYQKILLTKVAFMMDKTLTFPLQSV